VRASSDRCGTGMRGSPLYRAPRGGSLQESMRPATKMRVRPLSGGIGRREAEEHARLRWCSSAPLVLLLRLSLRCPSDAQSPTDALLCQLS